MTEQGVVTACHHGRQAFAVASYAPVADRVDATVDAVQAPRLGLARYCAGRVAESLQLPARHDAVLAGCELGQTEVRSHLLPHTGNKYERAPISPP